MSSSTILEDGMEKDIQMERDFPLSIPVIGRTESNLSKALDAEANIYVLPAADEVPISEQEQQQDDPGPPPNGGFAAWLQVAGSFFLFFNCWHVFHFLVSLIIMLIPSQGHSQCLRRLPNILRKQSSLASNT